jgi:hypothetical protein
MPYVYNAKDTLWFLHFQFNNGLGILKYLQIKIPALYMQGFLVGEL